MKNGLLKSFALGLMVAGSLIASVATADVNVTVNNGDNYLGFMNVFDLGNGYQFSSGWGFADLNAAWVGSNLRLSPNTIGDPDPYWYIGGGGPGHPGNKLMEANCYVEPAGSLPGVTLNFSGTVVSNTLTSAHVARAFIRDFAPDFSSVVETSVVLPVSGNFNLTLATQNDPGRHVQWGFQMKGPNVWVTDTAPFGAVVIGPLAPVPTTNSTWGRVKSLYR
ncbi:MAG: hypothetical protein U0704_10830 [Candidatus Eisenbacteria bacterium]